MGANVAASSAEKKALSKGAKAPSKGPSFEDVLNAAGGKKPKAKDVGPKPGGPIGLAAGVLENVVQKVAEENQKKKEITKALKEMKSKKNQDKYEASIKQAELEKLEAALQSSPEATQQTPINKLKAALQSSPEAAQQTSAALKEITSKKNQEKKDSSGNGLYEAIKAYKLKQSEQQANKEKYSSYSPFSKSDMPTAKQYQNPYPEYLFKGKAPQYGEYGSNFMSLTDANNPMMQAAKQASKNEKEVDAYGEALKKNQLEQLLAMIAQNKQKGKQG